MIARLRALYARHAAAHLTVTGAGFDLTDAAGRKIGAVEQVVLDGARVRLTGWALADRVTLQAGAVRVSARPARARHDVADTLGDAADAHVGFELAMPRPELTPVRPLILLVAAQGALGSSGPSGAGTEPEIYVVPMPAPTLARIRLAADFTWRLIRAVPDMLRWRRTQDPQIRARIKRRLGLDAVAQAGLLDRRILSGGQSAAGAGPAPITVVLPVYNAFDLLDEALDRLVRHTDLPFHLVAIEDRSSDDRVRPWLRDRCARADLADRVTLIENDANLGFIGSVNRGLGVARARGHDVVLLNSDALVPDGWAGRLLDPLRRDPGVASVTPMSNDAEIFSVPGLCRRTVLRPGMADAIDRVAARLDPVAARATAPTGVGFCMAIGAAWLGKVPELDPAFGRGYGEEVDWCQKVRAAGGRHLGTGTLFVEHRGSESFGSADKLKLVASNNAIVARRYPTYDSEVQAFIAADPLASARLALGLAWAGAQCEAGPEAGSSVEAVPVYLAHTMGGGADNYLDDRISADLAQGRPSVVLRVGGAARWQVELRHPEGVTSGATDDFDLVCALLAPIRRRALVYSCGVGDHDPVTLPGALLALAGRETAAPLPIRAADLEGARRTDPGEGALSATIEVLIHDFYPLSPSYTLLDGAGVYHGPLAPAQPGVATDRAHTARRPDGRVVDLSAWQAAWGALVQAADRITVFSDDSRVQVESVYPGSAAQIEVSPHGLRVAVPRLEQKAGGKRVIGVLGNIGLQKGIGVLGDLAGQIAARRDVDLAVIGNVDPAYPLPVSARVHGNYDLADLPALVARYGVTHWLIPSIWPETFSYTTHECLATGLPVLAFDIGAQGDAVRAAPNGVPVPFAPGGDLAGAILGALDAVDVAADRVPA